MIDYDIALCDVAEVMRRHNKAQIGGYILPSDVAVMRIRNIVTPHGQWIFKHNSADIWCSECGENFPGKIPQDYDYCPNCGAKMIKEDPEDVSR